MDTTKTYIKMCEKAEEIQRLVKDWDYGYDVETEEIGVRIAEDWQRLAKKEYGLPILSDDYYESWVWLPRQDQLQEIVRDHQSSHSLLTQFLKWLNSEDCVEYAKRDWKQPFSMEQLWLAFVISERYQKIWDGTDWIKEAK